MRPVAASLTCAALDATLLTTSGAGRGGDPPPAAAATIQAVQIDPAQWPEVVDLPGEDNDRIVLRRAPGVVWLVDDQRVDISSGQESISVPVPRMARQSQGAWALSNGGRVRARGADGALVQAPGALTTMDLEPEWQVRTFRGARSTTAVPRLSVDAYPRTLPATPRASVSYAPFARAIGLVWGHLQWRSVTATARGRTVGPWVSLPTFPGTPAGEAVTLTGSRGRTYEFRVRATDRADSSAASTVTGWSPPQAAALAQEASTATGSVAAGTTQARQRGAFGGPAGSLRWHGATQRPRRRLMDQSAVVRHRAGPRLHCWSPGIERRRPRGRAARGDRLHLRPAHQATPDPLPAARPVAGHAAHRHRRQPAPRPPAAPCSISTRSSSRRHGEGAQLLSPAGIVRLTCPPPFYGDFPLYMVFTWRQGKLVRQYIPRDAWLAPIGPGMTENLVSPRAGEFFKTHYQLTDGRWSGVQRK